jgi:serine/threonine protein phosphatase PrpC
MSTVLHEYAPGDLSVAGAMETHVGLIRKVNEDVVSFVIPKTNSADVEIGCLALVADGMGGHAAGDVASSLAAEIIRRIVYSSVTSVPKLLEMAFNGANEAIRAYAVNTPEASGMGTTCTAIIIKNNLLWLAHIGDSRAYLIRGQSIEQLSDDQTLHEKLIRDGVLNRKDAKNSPGGNYILQALGSSDNINPTIWKNALKLCPEDIIILCSDGLYNLVDEVVLAEVARAFTPQQACQRLIQKALEAGGDDNISIGIFKIKRETNISEIGKSTNTHLSILEPTTNLS